MSSPVYLIVLGKPRSRRPLPQPTSRRDSFDPTFLIKGLSSGQMYPRVSEKSLAISS